MTELLEPYFAQQRFPETVTHCPQPSLSNVRPSVWVLEYVHKRLLVNYIHMWPLLNEVMKKSRECVVRPGTLVNTMPVKGLLRAGARTQCSHNSS